MKKMLALILALCMALSLAACGGGNAPANNADNADNSADADANDAAEVVVDEAAAAGDELGFEEIPIFEDEEISFINVNAVYFQPVPMVPGMENYEDYDLHLECDVSAMENKLGYGVGDWIPYLTIDYRVIGSNGEDAASGTMMNMAASDGPHYGANIVLLRWNLRFTVPPRMAIWFTATAKPARADCWKTRSIGATAIWFFMSRTAGIISRKNGNLI